MEQVFFFFVFVIWVILVFKQFSQKRISKEVGGFGRCCKDKSQGSRQLVCFPQSYRGAKWEFDCISWLLILLTTGGKASVLSPWTKYAWARLDPAFLWQWSAGQEAWNQSPLWWHLPLGPSIGQAIERGKNQESHVKRCALEPEQWNHTLTLQEAHGNRLVQWVGAEDL